jgi:hypothetical protein
MSKKIVLTLLGVAALVVPVVLLIVFTNKKGAEPNISDGQRQINQQTVKNVVDNAPAPPPLVLPSPSSASPSAEPELEGSPSAE